MPQWNTTAVKRERKGFNGKYTHHLAIHFLIEIPCISYCFCFEGRQRWKEKDWGFCRYISGNFTDLNNWLSAKSLLLFLRRPSRTSWTYITYTAFCRKRMKTADDAVASMTANQSQVLSYPMEVPAPLELHCWHPLSFRSSWRRALIRSSRFLRSFPFPAESHCEVSWQRRLCTYQHTP